VLGTLPKITGVLSFAALIFFFIIHVSYLWDRLPVILGLCSSSLLLSLFVYLSYFKASVACIDLLMLLSFGLAFIGVLLDAAQCWYLIANAGKPTRPSVIPTGYVGNATHV
jgi:hypothetical protein